MVSRPLLAIAALPWLAAMACTQSVVPLRPKVAKRPPQALAASPGVKPWEALEVVVEDAPHAPPVPLTAEQLVTPPGQASPLDLVPEGSRDTLLRGGLSVAKPLPSSTKMGAFYKSVRARGVPSVVTLDALFELTHLALAEAIVEVDTKVVLPTLTHLLARVDAALALEAKGAGSDLLAPYTEARGVVAVARSLLEPSYAPPIDLAELVARETGRILTKKEAESPLLGVRLDYSVLAVRSGAPERARLFRTLAWLTTAPMALRERPPLADRVGLLRVHMRAALLLARAVRPDVDAEAARAWDRIEGVARFLTGAPDEPTLRDLDRVARAAGLDLRDGRGIADVTRVDRVRRALAKVAAARLDDGSPALVRFFAPRFAPDAEVLSLATRGPTAPRLPTAGAIVRWMRSEEAEEESHESLYLSALDAVATMARPSAADSELPAAAGGALAERRAEVARSAWTTLRHDFAAPGVELLARAPAPAAEPETDVPCFVEPHPEAIAKLLATVRQAQRGLLALGALADGSPARSVLGHVDQLLTAAFEVALLAASDEEATDDQQKVLSALPAWLDALEWATGSETPRVVDVHTDRAESKVLEEATGGVGELALVVREPGTGRLFVALGAAVPHYELTQSASDRLGDPAWRARLRAGSVPEH